VPHPDPLASAARLIVDGRNVLGAMRRAGGDVPPQALIGRLWTIVGAQTGIVVVFDGRRDAGAIVPERSPRLLVRWSGAESADDLIVRIAADGPDQTVVVTDDIELGSRVRTLGATSFRSSALLERFARQRQTAPGVGHGRPPTPGPTAGGGGAAGKGDDGPDRVAWKPGRGATRKTGNPKRGRPAS
jgi:predicted RNA-binding protein with PIN domain